MELKHSASFICGCPFHPPEWDMRLKYDIAHLAGRELRDFLTEMLRHLRKNIYVDKILLFHNALFDGNELATY